MSGSAFQLARWLQRDALTRYHRLIPSPAGLAILLLASALGPVAGAAETSLPAYLIGPGDALEITVWRQPELSTSVVVRPDGRISIPLVEDLVATGKSPMDLADEIEATLAQYLQDPLVLVTVGSGLGDLSQQIRVIGEAAEPAAIAYRSRMTALDALIAVGGLSRQADGNAAVILRRTELGYQEVPVRLADLMRDGDSTANVLLSPGDIIVIPEGFFTGEWRVTEGASASVTISDNVDQERDSEREAGLILRAGPNISIRGQSARVVGAFDGTLPLVQQIGGDDEGFSLDPRIAGTSTTEVLSNVVFFDLRAVASRQLLDSRDATSAASASTNNRDFVATMTASPYVVHRLADFADVEWRYSFSPVIVDSGNTSDVYSHDGSLIVDSGPDFSSFGWTWTNLVGEEVRTEEGDITTASTDFGVNYALWRGFALLGGVGYEYRDGDEDEDDNFDGITWRAGFSWVPHRDLNLQATYGRRQDDENLNASVYYRLGAKTTLRASYAEALQTSQQRAISALGRVTIDPVTGELIDETTGLPIDEDDLFTFDDETVRTRTFRLSVEHRAGRDTFVLNGLAGTADGGTEGDEEFYQARVTWSHPLSPEIGFTSSASYQRSDFQGENRTDDTYHLGARFTYQLSSDAQAFAAYNFQLRDSTDDDESFFENTVTVGLRITF